MATALIGAGYSLVQSGYRNAARTQAYETGMALAEGATEEAFTQWRQKVRKLIDDIAKNSAIAGQELTASDLSGLSSSMTSQFSTAGATLSTIP